MQLKYTKISNFLTAIFVVVSLVSCGIKPSLEDRPDIEQYNVSIPKREKITPSYYKSGNNFLVKNEYDLWELYIEGNPLEIGLTTGSLTQELYQKQERALFHKVEEFVPSKTKQYFLKRFLAWYNRKMYQHITEEYKTEIYGLSRYATSEYDDVAPPYLRNLYLHGAHDIGHALQDLALVGCTSFAVWGENTADGNLLVGRNFDFYVSDDFAEEKIIAFIKPTQGFPFMSVTWGGMIGVVSGMNTEGLSVTINAGKSEIPLVAKTPISLVTREILQYASTIEEAIKIAKKRTVFVSEAIMVSSANDNNAVLIEVSPDNFGVYQVENNSRLVCSNHFQSEAYATNHNNKEHIKKSHSLYRYERVEELLSQQQLTPTDAVAILRNKKGIQNKSIGYGNQKAINQLMAHHGIVFRPKSKQVWVSANPYQMGEFVAYDLDKIFNKNTRKLISNSLSEQRLTIPKDTFLTSQAYKKYKEYKLMEKELQKATTTKTDISPDFIKEFTKKNPEYWKAYFLVGKYYFQKKYYTAAKLYFSESLTKEIPTFTDKENVERYLKKATRKSS